MLLSSIDTHTGQSSSSGKGEDRALKVLIIADDRETTDLLHAILTQADFQVEIIGSRSMGIEAVRNLQPDVMIVDLLAPKTDGLALCSEVRQISSVPILVLSVVGRPGLVAQALDHGADDFLMKPMLSSVLIACVNKLARRARAEREAGMGNGNHRMV